MADLYLWRQVFILTTTLLHSINSGIMVSFPSVLSPALLSINSTDIQATKSQTIWLATSNGFAGTFGFFILSPIMQIYGRKAVHIVNNLFFLIGWVIILLARDTSALLAARIIQGFSIGAIYIHSMIISEYVEPKRRGYFMTLKKSTVAAGILICHASSLICTWRQLAGFVVVHPVLGIILTLFWPESPSYLAMKGRYKECEKSFVWLRGGSNMQELHTLLLSQLQKTDTKTKKWYKALFKKDFMKPFVIVSFLTLVIDLCGKYYYVVYVIQIMTELVGDKSVAIYCSIGADSLTVIALLSSCYIISCYRRRTILFSFGAAVVALMLMICFVIILKIPGRMCLTPALIILHSFIVNISIIPVCFTLIGEIFPLEHKGFGSCLTGIVFTLLYTLFLKLTPVLMESTGVEGVYAIYSIGIALCLILLYFVIPETKDRTLQDIENEFKGNKMPTSEEVIPL